MGEEIRVVLASASPRRKQLLLSAMDIECISVDVDERIDSKTDIEQVASLLAKRKALRAAKLLPNNCVILAADTLVGIDGEIFNKPTDYESALKMFLRLCNNRHEVITALCGICGESIITDCVKSVVVFKDYESHQQQINSYIRANKSFDKAGGYGIQDFLGTLAHIESGSVDNVMGLPLQSAITIINRLKILKRTKDK